MRSAVRAWARADGIDLEAYGAIMRDWFGEPVGLEDQKQDDCRTDRHFLCSCFADRAPAPQRLRRYTENASLGLGLIGHERTLEPG